MDIDNKKMTSQEIKMIFIETIEGSYPLNLAISILEDRDKLQQEKEISIKRYESLFKKTIQQKENYECVLKQRDDISKNATEQLEKSTIEINQLKKQLEVGEEQYKALVEEKEKIKMLYDSNILENEKLEYSLNEYTALYKDDYTKVAIKKVISLIKYHCEKDEDNFKIICKEIIKDLFDSNNESADELARYIQAQICEAPSFVPMEKNDD